MATGLRLSGADSASTSDHASLDITGDIDLRMTLSLDDWQQSAARLLTKGDFGSGQLSYIWDFFMSGLQPALQLTVSPTGLDGAAVSYIVDLPVGWTDGATFAIRQVIDVNNGLGGSNTSTYVKATTCATALADAASDADWSSVDTEGLGTTMSLHSGTAPLVIGNGLVGCVFAAVVKDGIAGTTVANPDFTTNPTSPFVDGTGKTWTLSAGAAIRGGCCGEADFWGWADDFNSNSQGWAVIN